MTSAVLTSISAPQGNESYPARRLRFSKSPVFESLVRFVSENPCAIGIDSIATEPDVSGTLLRDLGIDFATAEDVDFFLSTLSDTSLPGAGTVRTFISEDGHLQIEAFTKNGLYVHVIDGDAVVVCVANCAGAVQPHWAEAFERCAVPTAVQR